MLRPSTPCPVERISLDRHNTLAKLVTRAFVHTEQAVASGLTKTCFIQKIMPSQCTVQGARHARCMVQATSFGRGAGYTRNRSKRVCALCLATTWLDFRSLTAASRRPAPL